MAEKNQNKGEEQSSEMEKIAKSYRSGWAYAEYAFQYAMAIVVCSLLGYWLDTVFNTGNILLIIGVFLGAIAGFIGLLKSLNVLSYTKGKHEKK
jgi:F0F1-type ATP synthase assembly protein I